MPASVQHIKLKQLHCRSVSLKAYIPAGAVPIPGGTPVLDMSSVAPMKTQSGPRLGGHIMPGATGRVHRGAVWPRFPPAGHVVYGPPAAPAAYGMYTGLPYGNRRMMPTAHAYMMMPVAGGNPWTGPHVRFLSSIICCGHCIRSCGQCSLHDLGRREMCMAN
jgi:hypothetical protein